MIDLSEAKSESENLVSTMGKEYVTGLNVCESDGLPR